MPAPYLPLGSTLGFLSVVLFLLTVFLCVILLVLVMVSAIIIFQSDREKAGRKQASHLAAQTFHAEPSRSALPTRSQPSGWQPTRPAPHAAFPMPSTRGSHLRHNTRPSSRLPAPQHLTAAAPSPPRAAPPQPGAEAAGPGPAPRAQAGTPEAAREL